MKKSIVSFVIAAALVIGGVTVYASASGEAQRAAETEAVEKAKVLTQKGKSCVLSPAAASYGIFKNFEERGEVFRELVFGNHK